MFLVMALYPQTTCFYTAVVNQLPGTHLDDYEVLFEDSSYPQGYSPPLNVTQRYVIATKQKSKQTWHLDFDFTKITDTDIKTAEIFELSDG